MNKKGAVKDEILKIDKVMTVNDWDFYFSGVRNGAQWHSQRMDVSVGTIRRALDELVQEGKLEKYMQYGHCYDEWRYRKVVNSN